ncbi:MAG: hypothetical protein Q4C59_02575 [Lachnospiraceae bacterium]|nr:hypothetical protein [Lachnospiraceae bacterium]
MKKKIINLVFAFLFCIFMPISAFAASGNGTDIISFDDFYSALKAEYAKYNVDFEIENPNYDFCYTQEFLDDQLEFARTFCENLEVIVMDNNPSDNLPDNIIESRLNLFRPYAMPARYSWSKSYTVRSNTAAVPGFVMGTVYVSGDVNLQNSLVISHSGYQRTTNSSNVESNSLSVSTSITGGGKNVYVTLDGRVDFVWTEPILGSVLRANVYGPFWGESFRAENYAI